MPLTPGQVLNGRYTIQALLGQGGMGSVYRAFDQTLNRAVAIKERIPDPNASPQGLAQARDQFRREAQVLAGLSHQNLAHTYDYFSFGANEYVAMELIEGQPLDQAVARYGAIGEGAVRAWTNQALDALIYLHSQNPPIIHRDIKPANIILKPDGKIVLVDFGLVKLFDPNNPRTASAMRGVGTPEYAPMEQFSAGMYTTAQSDIYSLGATMYHLVVGSPPPDVPQRMLSADPNLAPRAANPKVSPQTEWVIQKATELRPQNRFQTADEMKRALNLSPAAFAQQHALSPSHSAYQQASHPVRIMHLPIGVWVGGVAVIVVICLLGLGAAFKVLMPTPTPTPTPIVTMTRALTPPPTIPTLSRYSYDWATPTLTLTPTLAPSSLRFAATPTISAQIFAQRLSRDNAEMVFVPAGEFTMGRDDFREDTRPAHKVNLGAFWIDRYQVTNGLYKKCVEAGKCPLPSRDVSRTRNPYFDIAQYDAFPVIYVAWQGANAYCEWAGKRLPTEAEWEKAARGTDGRGYPWGNLFDRNKLNSLESGRGDTTVVDYFLSGASPYGAQDMAGNVWEWIADWYDYAYYYNSPRDNPKGPSAGDKRVLRGGSWLDSKESILTFNRYSAPPGSASDFVGFRCAQDGSAATPVTTTPTATLTGIARLGTDNAEMVRVDAGEFSMGSNDGSDDEKPVHPVYLDTFWIDKYEVNNAQYKKCVDAGKCLLPSDKSSNTSSFYYASAQFDNLPVIYVSWLDAKTYCEWAGKRLPAEAEWEKAARGADGRKYPWGNTWDGTRLNSSDSTPRVGDTTEVGKYPSGASPYGVMDMAGNVWEWVADWYDAKYYANSPRSNPRGPASGEYRVLRGGSWNSNQYNVRASYRYNLTPGNRDNNIGFRCAQ